MAEKRALPSRAAGGVGGGPVDKGYQCPTQVSRDLRANPAEAELALWPYLSARRCAGARFNRQFPIGPFVVDFAARIPRLAIELDDGQHDWQAERDSARTRYIEAQGFRIIRFWNNDALESIEGVVAEIERVLGDMPPPGPSRKREGNRQRRRGP